ncbi:hypothetical protein BHE74_00009486 [Ensete ventricosum]|nr:hypothetical protein BHE74_00009486 [Ensete ventricosum]RZR77630.1 hypothetical protein BHM03_00002745 [Ensete ventricosum]
MSYEHSFVKKCDGHKLCANLIEFRLLFPASSRKFKILAFTQTLRKVMCKFEFQSVFHAPSRKFKILAIPNVLDHGKSYELGLAKKCDDHKLCEKSRAKSSFDRLFMLRLRNSKY